MKKQKGMGIETCFFLQQYSSNLLRSIPLYKRHPPIFQTHASLNILINQNKINQSIWNLSCKL